MMSKQGLLEPLIELREESSLTGNRAKPHRQHVSLAGL